MSRPKYILGCLLSSLKACHTLNRLYLTHSSLFFLVSSLRGHMLAQEPSIAGGTTFAHELELKNKLNESV